jgi:hypothetical protein
MSPAEARWARSAAQSKQAESIALKQQAAQDPSTLTGFLNTYSSWLMLGGAALLGLVFVGRGRR